MHSTHDDGAPRLRVGVVGLGSMGAPIAASLATAHDVQVFDEIASRTDAAAGAGARAASSAAELAATCDVLVTVLPGARETDGVVTGVVDSLPAGACWLDLGTGDPRVTTRLAAALGDRGVATVAAPMGGGPASARARDLHFTVAGAAAAVERLRPVLAMLAADDGIEHIGEDPAHAQTVKLLSNLLWFGQVVAVTEAMLLGGALGMEPHALRALLAERAGGSVLLERDYEAVLRGDWMPSFGIDRVVDQLATARSIAQEHAVPFALSALVERTHREALAAFGPIGGELLAARLLEEQAGRRLSG